MTDFHHEETSPLICFANQSTGFYMTGISVMKELKIATYTSCFHAMLEQNIKVNSNSELENKF